MSRVLSVLLFASVVVIAACDDEAPETKPLAPTAPMAAPDVSPAVALGDAQVKVKGSSVCASYSRERTKLLEELKKTPKDTALLTRAKSLAAVITDACN